MFPRVGELITNQDSGTQNIFEREDQNSEGSVILVTVTDEVTSNTVKITNREHSPCIHSSRFGKGHRKL